MAPFLIFSLRRSGSTTLMRMLNALPGMRCVREPFNARNFDGRYHERVHDEASLRAVMTELWSSYDGIKHVWEADGWPFTDAAMNARLALLPGQRVVFLRRRNVLQRVVSLQISEQADVWSAVPTLDRERLASHPLVPLDIETVRKHVATEATTLETLRDALRAAGAEVLDVWYEELYDARSTAAERRARAEPIANFVGRSFAEDVVAGDKVDRLLDPAQTRLNSRESYARIPRIHEIEAACGSAQTGWLFRS